jgi:hypothetical protein
MLQNVIIETYNTVSFSSAQAGQQYLGPGEPLSSPTTYLVSCDDGLDGTLHNSAAKVTLDGLHITRLALQVLSSRARGLQCG